MLEPLLQISKVGKGGPGPFPHQPLRALSREAQLVEFAGGGPVQIQPRRRTRRHGRRGVPAKIQQRQPGFQLDSAQLQAVLEILGSTELHPRPLEAQQRVHLVGGDPR